MQRKDGEREREYAGEDGDAENVHIVLLGGISPDDGVDAEESREQSVRRGGEQGFKQETSAERFYNFINFLRGHSKCLLTNLAVKKAIMNNT